MRIDSKEDKTRIVDLQLGKQSMQLENKQAACS
jgi:hypothetical protein